MEYSHDSDGLKGENDPVSEESLEDPDQASEISKTSNSFHSEPKRSSQDAYGIGERPQSLLEAPDKNRVNEYKSMEYEKTSFGKAIGLGFLALFLFDKTIGTFLAFIFPIIFPSWFGFFVTLLTGGLIVGMIARGGVKYGGSIGIIVGTIYLFFNVIIIQLLVNMLVFVSWQSQPHLLGWVIGVLFLPGVGAAIGGHIRRGTTPRYTAQGPRVDTFESEQVGPPAPPPPQEPEPEDLSRSSLRCSKCGKEIESEWNLCPWCGNENIGSSPGELGKDEAIDKLKDLKEMKEKGLITEEEHREKQESILDKYVSFPSDLAGSEQGSRYY